MAENNISKHPPNFRDLTSQRFSRLTVLSIHSKKTRSGSRYWSCVCDCGKATIIRSGHLTSGATESCGCIQREKARLRFLTHGLRKTREYRAWRAAKDRCFRAKCGNFADYGGRGITMCEEWRDDFTAFLRDMGPCPPGHTLERRDVNGNYEPSNCCWATQTTQARNKRTSLHATHNGRTLTITEWAQLTGLSYYTLRRRQKAGKPLF